MAEDEGSEEVLDPAVTGVVLTLNSAVLPLVLSVAVLVAVVAVLLEVFGASVVIGTMMLVLLPGVITVDVVNTAVVVVPEGLKLRKKKSACAR